MQWFDKLTSDKHKARGTVGIEISVDGLMGVMLTAVDAEKPQLNRWVFKEAKEAQWQDALLHIVESLDASGCDLYICFTPEFYELMLIDAPEVADDELTQAVKWRVKDLLPESIENYVVDAFRLPDDAYRGRMDMIYVACINKQLIQRVVEICDDLPVALVELSINELARCRLFADASMADQSLALVDIQSGGRGKIDLIENQALYLSRNVDIEFDAEQAAAETPAWLNNGMVMDSLALDIQRSLDYYESQLGKMGVSKIYLLSHEPLNEDFLKDMTRKLPVKVESFGLESAVTGAVPNELLSNCCSAIGAAMGGRHHGN